MKVDVIQTSFAGGEFGPSLYGRTDIVQYANACQIVQNMLPRSYGPAISMPGTKYVATVSDSSLVTRLIKFVFNRTDAYVIETGDKYMRFFTNRGQVVTPAGTEDLSAFSANLKAHWKCNDNTNSTTVLDATSSHNGSASTLTTSLSTTAIVSTGFNLNGRYHISVPDDNDFTRTSSTQPMTVVVWGYYESNGASQCLFSKSSEYELSINSSDQIAYMATSGGTDTKLLLHCNGVDASTTFTDSSASANTVTANGDAQIDTAQAKFGTASGLFDGSGDYLSVPDSADWDFGTTDFTVDFWVRFSSVSGGQSLIDRNNTVQFGISKSSSGGLNVAVNAVNVISEAAWAPSIDTWYHVAVARAGSTLKAFINGAEVASVSNSSDVQGTTAFIIGNTATPGTGLIGWMDEIRVVKGTAIWTGAFTPSDEQYAGAATNSWLGPTVSRGWHLFSVVFKGTGASSSDLKLYVDGEIVSTAFTADPSFVKIENTTSLFRIGTTSSAGLKNWKNKLDNLAFIHQELTAAQVLSLYSTTAYQITTVFPENEVFDLQYAQLNDVIWIAHPDHPPQKLIRTSANEWTIADFAFTGGPFLDDNTTTVTITPSATAGTVNLTVTPTTTSLFTLSTSTLGHHNSFWMIGGLAQTNSTTGLQEEGFVQITYVTNSYTCTATVIKNLKAASATALWAEGAWSAVRGYPKCVALHERRLWFARTGYEPQKLWGSKVFLYDQFHLDTQADDDGLNLGLASNESNEIQWLASMKSLVAGIYGGAFVINSRSTDPITPDNANASEEVAYGAEDILPKKIGSFLYYIQRFGKKLREMLYSWDSDTYKAVDKTILSPHVLGDGVIDMDAIQNPETILCCVLTSGTLVTMTREVDQEVTAWARHTTSGTYSSIAVIPSQAASYDEAWVIVERYVGGNKKRYVEYFENIEVPARQDLALYLHSALTYDAYKQSLDSNINISLTNRATFADSSTSAHVITANGDAQISTAQSVFGGASALFDGTGDWIDTPDHADFAMGSGDFTIDFWFRTTTVAGDQFPAGQLGSGAADIAWYFEVNTTTLTFAFSNDGSAQVTATASGFTAAINTWYHFAAVRNGNTITLYVDGVAKGTSSVTGLSMNNSTKKLAIGRGGEAAGYITGWIDEFRFSNVARWTANFTPPTSAYTADSSTVLLIHANSSDAVIATVTSSTGAFVSGDVGKRIRGIDPSGTTVGEGTITSFTSSTVVNMLVSTSFDDSNYSGGEWGLSVSTVSGLDHLLGKTVGILADGLTESLTRTVASNAVTLGSNYFVIHVGLSYDQILFTLPKETGNRQGTAQGKLQRYSEIAFKLNRSTQNFKYGPDASNLDDVNLAITPTVTTLYTGILPSQGGAIAMRGGYFRGAQIYIKNSNPLPIEMLSIIGALETEEK